MQEYNNVKVVVILDLIIFGLAIFLQLSSASAKTMRKYQETGSDTTQSSYSQMIEKTESSGSAKAAQSQDQKNDVQEPLEETKGPEMIEKIEDIDGSVIEKMKQYQKEYLDAMLVKDPALDYFFDKVIENTYDISPYDYAEDKSRYFDNLRLYSMHLLTNKNSTKRGELYFCYTGDVHILGQTITGYFYLKYDLKLNNPKEPVESCTDISDKRYGGYLEFDEWYRQTITRIGDRFSVADEKYFE